MFEYNFFNNQTGEEWTVTGCNSKEDAIDYMRENFPNSFYDWEYTGRKGFNLSLN